VRDTGHQRLAVVLVGNLQDLVAHPIGEGGRGCASGFRRP
jgi:hypothetical protein